jgi:hypothetical protein
MGRDPMSVRRVGSITISVDAQPVMNPSRSLKARCQTHRALSFDGPGVVGCSVSTEFGCLVGCSVSTECGKLRQCEELIKRCKFFGNRDFAKRPRGAARSARHPVKVEAMGSNPIGGAEGEKSDGKPRGTVRKPAKRPSSNLGGLWVRLPLVPVCDVINELSGGVPHGGL